ncbi:MAG: ferritin-like domain-containing protein [Chloroflexota bacterium]|nr:ferritin-like domain-containing protein [Chloroflexota bacterium]
MAHHKLFVAWLNDAYASENAIVETLEKQVDAAADFPEIQSGIQRHLEASQGHAETVKGCLESLGESPSVVKTGMAEVGGKLQGMMQGMAQDKLVKAALQDYATEHMEIASYKALIVAADDLGHPEIAEKCRTILQDEEAMAAWLDQQLPMVVRATLSQAHA